MSTTTHLGHVALAGSPAAELLVQYQGAVRIAELSERARDPVSATEAHRAHARGVLAYAVAATGYQGFLGADVVVTVPARVWSTWLSEGDAAGEVRRQGGEYWFNLPTRPRNLFPGSRVYVVAHGRVRGFAPLVRIDPDPHNRRGCLLIRHGDAVAVTIPEPVRGFQGYRYRWWERAHEAPFPDWRAP